MRRIAAAMGVAALVASAGASSQAAAAETVAVTQGALAGGPAFVGGGVAWAERAGNGELALQLAEPGASPRSLVRLSRPTRSHTSKTFTDLEGSSTHFAYLATSSTVAANGADLIGVFERHATSLIAGPIGGARRRLSGPGPTSASCPRRRVTEPLDVDLETSVVAFTEEVTGCLRRRTTQRTRVVVIDLATGRRQVLADRPVTRPGFEPAVLEARIAGPYVSWLNAARGGLPTEVVVYDLAAKRRHHTIRIGRAQETILGYDLQADGKVALSTGAYHEVLWFSQTGGRLGAARPGRMPSGSLGPISYDPHVAHDRVAFNRANPSGGSELAVVDFAGEATVFDRFGRRIGLIGLDLADDRIVWASSSDGTYQAATIQTATLPS